MKKTIRNKMLLAFGGVCLVLLGQLLVNALFLSRVQRSVTFAKDVGYAGSELTGEIKLDVVQVQQWLTDISATRAAEGFDDGFRKAEEYAVLFRTHSEQLKALYPDKRQEVEALQKSFAAFYEKGRWMAGQYVKGGAELGNKAMGEFDGVAEDLTKRLDALEREMNGEAERAIATALGAVRLSEIIGIVLALAVIAFVVTLAVFFSGRIAAALQKMVNLAEAIAKGDLGGDYAVATAEEDEIGQLQAAMARMVKAIEAAIADVDRLVAAAWQGRLATRADAASHQGDYRKIVEGINNIMNRLVGLLDIMPAPAMIIDSDFTVLYMNELGARVGGKTQAQLIGTKCYDHFRTSDCRTDRCACGQAIRGGGAASSTAEAHPAAGVDLDIAYNATPLRDAQGKVIGAFEVVSDQTAVKQAARVAAKVASYQEIETCKLVECLGKLARGDNAITVETEPADSDTAAVKQVFDGIGAAVSSLVAALNEITGVAREIAGGNLMVSLRKRSDEDQLIQALQDMTARLKEIITDVRAAADQVAAGSQELSGSSQEVSQGASEQAASVEEISSSMEELASTVAQSADNARQTAT
ncbi:MAG: PAS domain-containing protein, partial [Thermodesulfobacteriota bacterium]